MTSTFWLVTTAHLPEHLWFRDEEDYKAGMNFVAILAAQRQVLVLAFILMSNHVHFVLSGSQNDSRRFIDLFKKSYSQYFRHKYGTSELLRKNGVDLKELYIGDESFERAVAYVHMNSVAANICVHASDYPWGTGSTFFNLKPFKAIKIKQLSGRKVSRSIHSRAKLLPDYLMDESYYILPISYVPVKFVEEVFRTPKRMGFFLKNSSKARKVHAVFSFSDQLLSQAIRDLSISLFHKSRLCDLTDYEASELLKIIRYKFSADPNQISRVAEIPYERVTMLLETI